MIILPNGVAAIDGDTCHLPWVRDQGLIHDAFMSSVIRRLCREYAVTVAVDGGANIGTLTAVLLGEGVETYAFEPNPQAAKCLVHNCPGAIIHPVGLSSAFEYRVFARQDNAGASYVHPRDSGLTGEIVELAPLDEFNFHLELIKLDVEGCEIEALLGAEDTILNNKPVILCEVNEGALQRYGHSRDELFTLLHDFGYLTEIVQPDCCVTSPQYDIIARP